ncbi:MAG TPA: PilZ domain-containing protein [Candidatus Baltobacteraceae bacterium]|nr:PilZ domain-containing protein [Candidatus Baltobacteraceae bacterium]
MAWGRRTEQAIERNNQRRTYRQSIELPIAVEVAGLPAPVYGTLVNISETGCRLRSLILIDRDRDVSFELKRPGHRALLLRGRIVSRSTPPSGGGFEYGVTFALPKSDREILLREIQEMQRREAAARAEARTATPAPQAATGKQRRGSVRTLVGFPVRFRLSGKANVAAEANDVSMGGLRLITEEKLELGVMVELRFTLPGHMLWVYPPAEERTEITPFGPRRIRIPDNRRPFEEMVVRGRVVSRFAPQRGREVYGVQFTDIDGYQREEVARFTHAVQLAKLRLELDRDN